MRPCGFDGLNYDNQQEIAFKGVNAAQCVSEENKQNFRVGGTFYSPDFYMIEARMYACKNSSTNNSCASDDD